MKREELPAAVHRGVDRLLQARDVGGKGGHEDAPGRLCEQRSQSLPHPALAWGRALLLGVGRVAEQQQHAVVAKAGQPGQVGRRALHRRLIDLEVAGVDDDPLGGVQRQRARVGDGVGDVDPLDSRRSRAV